MLCTQFAIHSFYYPKCQHSWVAALWPEKLSILLYAMNGTEKLTSLLKANHIESFLISTLYDLVKALLTSVVPDFYRK